MEFLKKKLIEVTMCRVQQNEKTIQNFKLYFQSNIDLRGLLRTTQGRDVIKMFYRVNITTF